MIRRTSLATTGSSGGTAAVYPLAGYGFHSATDNITAFTTNSTIGTFYARVPVPAGEPITAAATIVTAAGTVGAGGLNSYAIYDDTTGALLGSTPSDDALWATAGWRVKNLTTLIAAQPTARYVIAAMTANGYSAAATIPYVIIGPSSGAGLTGGNGVTNRRAFFGGGLSSWAATINPATDGTTTNFLPLIALG